MAEPDSEQAVADFWSAYVDAGRGGLGYVVRNPLACGRALRAIGHLPVVRAAHPSKRSGGQAVKRVLAGRGPLGVPARLWGTAALAVPADPSAHLEGRGAQTLRRKIRAAERHGLSCRRVTRAERISLLDRADEQERDHHDLRYRVVNPSNRDLLLHDLWMVAEDDSGHPLLLAVIPFDGHLAALRYFRTLGVGESYSLSRYLATHAVVRELADRGVRWLLDTEAPGAQTNGLRHFQRMVGFRYVRIQLEGPDIEAAQGNRRTSASDYAGR